MCRKCRNLFEIETSIHSSSISMPRRADKFLLDNELSSQGMNLHIYNDISTHLRKIHHPSLSYS